MLERALIENIVNTKIFLQGKRKKLMRKITIYNLLQEERKYKRYEETDKDYDDGITTKYLHDNKARLLSKIIDNLQRFSEREISKMRNRIENGKTWHGYSMKEAFKRCNIKTWYEEYFHACTHIHVREEDPRALTINDKDNISHAKYIFSSVCDKILNHFYDYEKICQKSISEHNILSIIKDKEKRLLKIQLEMANEINPDLIIFIKV